MFITIRILMILPLLCAAAALSHQAPHCKCTPNTPCFPNSERWSALNQSLGGRLIASVPPASVCYRISVWNDYNETLCQLVSSQWFSSSFHADNPSSIDYPIWANDSCVPINANGTSITGDDTAGARGCTLGAGAGGRGVGGGYPYYVVNATTAEHVSVALTWASIQNVRVVVKSTGHSYSGRSTTWGSLSIWTHHMKSFHLDAPWKPEGTPKGREGQMAAIVGAGMQDDELYKLTNASGAVVVGGSDPNVGIVGWMTGGGHGPLSAEYGMGADNLLQATIVLASGQVVVANEYSHPELYWALRGGGGGTFGVITEAVIKAFPTPKTRTFFLKFGQTVVNASTDDTFYSLMANLHRDFVTWKAAGIQGYYGIIGPPLTSGLVFVGSWWIYNKPNGTIEQAFTPFQAVLDKARAEGWLEYGFSVSSELPSFYDAWPLAPEAVAQSGSAYGSRLISKCSLMHDTDLVKRTLQYVGSKTANVIKPEANPFIIGHMIANDANRGLDIAMNPGWRDAVVHMIVAEGWKEGSPQVEIEAVYNDITYNKVRALKELSPELGAYFNEPDAFEPNWQSAFWGKNYPRLRSIKRRYDPNGLFWCRNCVGSEAWVEEADGRLCGVQRSEEQHHIHN